MVRTEKDSMGLMQVPDAALYGASTARAVLNFPISGYRVPQAFIRTMGLLKWACAKANEDLGLLDAVRSKLIQDIAWEIYEGQYAEHFPVDVFQTGSATSSNMNVNEVIANRASQMMGKPMGSKDPQHPNDCVNMGQSSNDCMPTCLHVSLAVELKERLVPSLRTLEKALEAKAKEWSEVVKIGRTHLMDATPLTLGQEFSGYAMQVSKAIRRVQEGIECLQELAIGGTAVGTGLNTHPQFAAKVIQYMNAVTELQCVEAPNHFEAQGIRDDSAHVAGILTTVAGSLMKIANDLRLLGSGPRCGIGEITFKSLQPGSSIMPGKTNPVMSEMLIQVGMHVSGLCHTSVLAAREGYFELGTAIPLLTYTLHEAIRILSQGVQVFASECIEPLTANSGRCRELLEQSLMLVTALTQHIGYDKAAEVAKRAHVENKTLREVVLSERLMEPETLDQALKRVMGL